MNLISIKDLGKEEILELFKLTNKLKKEKKPVLKNKILAMIFEKPSTRTRISFEVAMLHLGGHAIYLSPEQMQLTRGESLSDTARVLSRYVDGVVARVFSHKTLLELAKYSSVPVINGLSDLEHPCQALSDLYTIKEHFGKLDNLRLAFFGDCACNTSNSLLLLSSIFKLEYTACCPPGYEPYKKYLKDAKAKIEREPRNVKADILYTDSWVSMGFEKESEKRLKDLAKYQLNGKILSTNPKSVIMHCLPAHRGEEITSKVMDSKNSLVLKQAENRLYVQKAILVKLLK